MPPKMNDARVVEGLASVETSMSVPTFRLEIEDSSVAHTGFPQNHTVDQLGLPVVN